MNEAEMKAELERLRAENAQLKTKEKGGITLKVSEKGAVSPRNGKLPRHSLQRAMAPHPSQRPSDRGIHSRERRQAEDEGIGEYTRLSRRSNARPFKIKDLPKDAPSQCIFLFGGRIAASVCRAYEEPTPASRATLNTGSTALPSRFRLPFSAPEYRKPGRCPYVSALLESRCEEVEWGTDQGQIGCYRPSLSVIESSYR